jgi:competence protein ComEC
MIDKRPLIFYCIALIFGCYSAAFVLNNTFLGAVFAASFLACIFFTMRSKLVIVAATFFVLGFVNYILYFEMVPAEYCSFRLQKLQGSSSLGNYRGRKILLKGDLEAFKEGEILFATGEFKEEPRYERGIIGEFYISSVKKSQSDFLSKIYVFKNKLYNKYKDEIGEDAAGEVMAASFGDISKVKSEAMTEMSELGIIHVISVSGLHMAIIYKLCEGTLGFGFGMFLSLLYCVFTGAEPSTVRSLIMIIVFKLSKKVYKNYDPLSSFSMAAIIILFINPTNAHDIGALLSFLSVLGIFLFYNRLKKVLWILPNKLNDYISLTLSAQVFSLPICIMVFNSVSTATIQGNIFLVPLYSALLLLGNLSMLAYGINFIFKWICWLLKVVFWAIQGGKEVLLFVSTGVLYMSYIEACILIIIYISYFLFKKGYKKFVWLPLFSVIFYLASAFTFVPKIEYVKVGYNKGIIYRSGLQSILFIEKSKIKEVSLLLCKKFNVWNVMDIGKDKEILYKYGESKVNVRFNSDKVFIDYSSKDEKLKVAFVKNDIPVLKDNFYDIIYLAYLEDSYHYYDKLASFKLTR